MLKRLSLATGILLAVTIACAGEGPTTPTPPVDRPMPSGGTCHYAPSSITLPVDSAVTIWPDSDCAIIGRYATLTWSNPQTPARATFAATSSPCNRFSIVRAPNYKVARCAEGEFTLTIYADSTATTILQTIVIDDLP